MSEHFTPGLHEITAERYFSANGVSASMLDILADKTPAHLLAWTPKVTAAKRFGAILHYGLLQPEIYQERFHVRPEGLQFTTKEGKAWKLEHQDRPIISFDEAQQIDAMATAVRTHPFAKRLLSGGKAEQSLFVEDNGIIRKSRLDMLTKGNVLSDVKTVESASLDFFERSISTYRYHARAAYYLDNCNMAGIQKDAFFFICVEKSPPYCVRCLQLMPEVIEFGRVLYRRDLQVYRNCVETGKFPAWGDGFEDVGLPSWAMKQLENELIT